MDDTQSKKNILLFKDRYKQTTSNQGQTAIPFKCPSVELLLISGSNLFHSVTPAWEIHILLECYKYPVFSSQLLLNYSYSLLLNNL